MQKGMRNGIWQVNMPKSVNRLMPGDEVLEITAEGDQSFSLCHWTCEK